MRFDRTTLTPPPPPHKKNKQTMPKPVTGAASASASAASVGEDSMMAEARQIIAAHDRSEMGEAKQQRSAGAHGKAGNGGPGNKMKKPQAARRPPNAKPEAGMDDNDAAAKNDTGTARSTDLDQHLQVNAQRNKNSTKKGSPASTASSAAQTARVRNQRQANNTNTNKTRNSSSKNRNRNRIVVDTSGSDAVKAQAAAAAAAAASASPKSARTDRAVNMVGRVDTADTSPSNTNGAAHFNDSGEYSGDHSAATLSTGNKSQRRVQQQQNSPPLAPTTTTSQALAAISEAVQLDQQSQGGTGIHNSGGGKVMDRQSSTTTGMTALVSVGDDDNGVLGPARNGVVRGEGTNRSEAGDCGGDDVDDDMSARTGATGATNDDFMRKFVSKPSIDEDDMMSRRSVQSAPSVSATVMMNAIDPTRRESQDDDDDDDYDDDSTLNGTLNQDDDGDDDASSATGLIQAASKDSNSNMRRRSPPQTSPDVPPTSKTIRTNKAWNHAKANPNKKNVAVVGEPSPADASIDRSMAQRSTATDAALNGEELSGRTYVTDSTESVKEASIAATATASSRTSPTKHTSPKVASQLSVQSARSPLSSPDSQQSQRQMGSAKATSPHSIQSAQSPLSSPDSQRSQRQVAANPSADSHDPSIGAVSTLSALSAGAQSVRSSQSQRSIKQSHSTRSGQSKVPEIDLNADDGSKMTTDTRQLNDKLQSSVDKERKSSRKLENIVGVLGEDDPLSQAIRKVEDGDSTRSGVAAATASASSQRAGSPRKSAESSRSQLSNSSSASNRASASDVIAAIASSVDDLNGSSNGASASDIVAAIASSAEDLDVRTSPSGSLRHGTRLSSNQSVGDGPLRGSGNRSVASVAARTTASAASRRSEARTATTVPPTLSPTMSAPYSFSNKDIIQDNIENGGHSGKANDGARTVDNEPKPMYRGERTFVQRNRKALLLGFGLVAIVAAIAGIAVAASSKRSSTSSASDADSFMGTPSPTPFLTLESVLSTWSPDDGVAMKALPFSPQGIAYAWIKADLETLGYDPNDLSGYDNSVAAFEPRRMADRVKTRYALSVLNYTFWGGSGAGVASDTFDAWSHENDECNFARVFCEYDGEGFGDGLVRVLDLDEADIPEGSVLPGEVTMLNDLNALVFTSTRLGGKIPDVFSPMQDLRILDLDDCVFTGTVPESIGTLLNLEELRLNDNILEGPLPDLFWNLKFLRVLELQKNLFTGTISQSIWSLGPSLEDLRIGDNELTGTLSTQIGNLRNLERFWAYSNQLTGKIPTQFGQLSLLNDLAMDDNRFVGAIPKQLASCPLTELWLNTNRLSSSIPAALGEIFGLENLYLDENLLTGTVSSESAMCIGEKSFLFFLSLTRFSAAHSIFHQILPTGSFPAGQFIQLH